MATITVPPTVYTPDDLLKLPDGERYELVDGQLIEDEMSLESFRIAGIILGALLKYAERLNSGYAFPDGFPLRCFPDDPNRVRKPDACFVSKSRLPEQDLDLGFCPVAPELVVEVVSPTDIYHEVERKVSQYLKAGVRLIWVISPQSRTVVAYHGTGAIEHLVESDTLIGGDVLPDFEFPIAKLFRPKSS